MNTEQVQYWDNFYKTFDMSEPSEFAKHVASILKKKPCPIIMELGSGNCRDAMYFAKCGLKVTAVDSSFTPPVDLNGVTFVHGDMVSVDKKGFNTFYMRFSLHSITDEAQEQVLISMPRGSDLYVETRSDVDKLEEKVHGDSHYRNYTNLKDILTRLEANNFEVSYVQQSRGLAVWKEEDPMCIRLVAHKV